MGSHRETSGGDTQPSTAQTSTMVEGLNPRIGFAIAAGAIGSSFQHGYNTGVLNAPRDMITSWVKGYVCPDVVEQFNKYLNETPVGMEANRTAFALEMMKG